jgi:hypothetical protein
MIREKLYIPEQERKEDYFVFDFAESKCQFERIFYPPLETDNVPNDQSFFSWKGRGVCLLHLAKTIIREPFRLVKHVFVIIDHLAQLILNLLNFAFSEEARENFLRKLHLNLSYIVHLAIRPIAFAIDLLKLLGGAVIHPALAIGAQKVQV